jgi:primosomal protein N' (replication factor Y)
LSGVETRRVVEVAVPLPVDEAFHYALPPGVEVAAGTRVLVPCAGRRLTGVVLRERASAAGDLAPLSEVLRVLDAEPALPPELVGTLLEAARDALCPPGVALAAALPAGTSPRAARRVQLAAAGRRALLRSEVRGRTAELLRALAARPLAEAALRARFADLGRGIDRLLQLGWIARGRGSERPRVGARMERVYRLSGDVDLGAARARLARAPRRLELLERLGSEPVPLALTPALRALLAEGIALASERPVPRALEHRALGDVAAAPEPTAHQRAAIDAVVEAIRARKGTGFLLYGITGSGKTEVYLRAAQAALECDRGVLVLVPEISLTHQVVDRFRARFGGRVAVLHSALSAAERYEHWRSIREGRVPIAIGARSAVFAPFEQLGLVVVDEEHDPAYKSADAFRYHARDLALLRARASGAACVLGSATPDVETAWRTGRGELRRLLLPERVARRPLPAVEVVDMEREQARRGRRALLSAALRRALNEALGARQQSILFLNRRGFATLSYCFTCGHALRCAHCDISLVYHAAPGRRRADDPLEGDLRCHYCGHSEPPSLTCPACGSREGGLRGFGTERLAEEVASTFPHARVARLDRDTSARRGAQRELLAAFHRGEIDVLVGTQMVAKGHDVPNVTLVGVVAADLGLHFPDFRAGERTFQLLTQVAGRAGRGDQPGRVVIQTWLPHHYAIALAATQDFPRFYREELARREPHGYPPFRSLVHAGLSGARAEAVERAAYAVAALAKELGARERAIELLGPAPAPLARIRDEFRWQLLLLGEREPVRELARELARRARPLLGAVALRLDASPLQML